MDLTMDLREIGRDIANCNSLTQDRDQYWYLLDTVMNFRVQLNWEFVTSFATGSFLTGAHVYGVSLVNSSFYDALGMERE
jgi:hypothetical protein